MILANYEPFRPPVLPDYMKPYITWSGNCELNDTELTAFYHSLNAFADEFQQRPDGCKLVNATLFLLKDQNVNIRLDNPEAYGHIVRMIFYPIYLWRQNKFSQLAMCLCILEELCHLFYCEDDEINVEGLVIRCLTRIYPTLRKEDVYNPRWTPDAPQ